MKKNYFVTPYVLWSLVFIVVPLIMIVYFSLYSTGEFSLEYIKGALSKEYLSLMWRSVYLALICTVFCLALGYPVAYILSQMKSKIRGILLFLVIAPMWMNFLLRTYAWKTLLEKEGLLNRLLELLNLPQVELLYSPAAVVMGMIYNFLPFMILPIYTVLSKLDKSVLEASYDLGASKAKTFTKVILPLSMPGVVSGITMVFMPAVTTFVISSLLGGSNNFLIGDIIQRYFKEFDNPGMGSALSVVLLVMILICIAVTSKYDKEGQGGGLL